MSNSRTFADALTSAGFSLVSGGTDNHLVLVDLRPSGIDGARAEKICEVAGLAVNKNTVPGDKSALVPSGIRMGTPALTSRGFDEADFKQVAAFFARAVAITKAHKADCDAKGLKKVADFRASIDQSNPATWPAALVQLQKDIAAFSQDFPVVGFDSSAMRYKA